ncbi:hypothetical protein GGI12_002657 [Dipsacomyces acuminosporus]|nr:hypothetical protein GGI12_002657 [Dipsacomyces acuminosporus]
MSFHRDKGAADNCNPGALHHGEGSGMDMDSISSPLLQSTNGSAWNGSTSPMINRDSVAPVGLGPDGKRQRVSRACDRCRRKKVKCDGSRPVCSHCQAIGASCTYLDVTKKRGPPKGYIEAIESRLHQMEHLLSGLVDNDTSAARFILSAIQDSGEGDKALVPDSNGRLFGDTTLAALKARAAHSHRTGIGGSPMNAAAATFDSAIASLQPTTNDTVKSLSIDAEGSSSSNGSSSSSSGDSKVENTSLLKSKQLEKTCTAEDCSDVDCSVHLTHLEKGVGHLTLDPTGALRYLGNSSGWYIINRNLVSSESSPRLTKGVDGAFRWPPITSIPTRESEANPQQAAGSGSVPEQDKPCVVAVPRNMPPCGKPPMPDSDEANRLIQLYFRYVHPVFPILYKSYFLERFYCKENRPSPALLSAVFAAASTYKAREAKCESDLARVRIQMAVHFQRAKLYLDEQYTLNTTPSILTLLLMSVYEQGTMSTRSWLYSGMAIRKAYDLGLHRDPAAAVAVADRLRDYVSLSVGESESDGSDVEGDEEFGERRPQENKPLGVYYLELLHILGHILTEMYACKPHRSFVAKYCLHDLHSRTERLIILDHELRQWKISLPTALQYPVDDILAARPARCVHIALIHLVYYTAMILLHRPFISRLGDNPGTSASGDPSSSASQPNTSSPLPSHAICTLSAQMISLIGQAIIQDSRIFIMPFLTFMMFTAGTLHLNNVIVAADSWIARRFLKRTLDVMSRLGAHWQVSYKCYTMLNTLVRANRIGLDQVIDDSEAGARVIKERCREISRMAHSVYENRALYNERRSSTRLNTMQTASPQPQAGASQAYGSADSAKRAGPDSAGSSHSTHKSDGQPHGNTVQQSMGFDAKAGQDGEGPVSSSPLPRTQDSHSLHKQPSTSANATAQIPAPGATNTEPVSSCMGSRRYSVAASAFASASASAHMQVQEEPRHRRKTMLNAGSPSHADNSSGGYATNTGDKGLYSISAAAKILSSRHKFDKDGLPIVPASPYSSVNLSDDRNSSASLLSPFTHDISAATSSSALSSQGGVSVAVDASRTNLPATPAALGQFVPSLEFFANADFPLGIGGPNGQASTVLPAAIAMNRPSAGLQSLLSFSDQLGPSPGLGALTTAAAVATSASAAAAAGTAPFVDALKSTDIDAFATTPSSAGNPAIGSYSKNSSGNGIAKALTNAASVVFPPTNVSGAPLAASVEAGGFGYNNPSNFASPVGMWFDGKFIADDVIRNMPFSGPVSCDLGLNGMDDPSSSAAAAAAAAALLPGAASARTFAAASGPVVGSGTALSSEMPWKDYVNQVVRMFNADHAADSPAIDKEASGLRK